MPITLFVTSPTNHPNHLQAIQCAKKLSVDDSVRVFFYDDAVYVGSNLFLLSSANSNACIDWKALAEKHGVILQCCVAAAVRRGLYDATEAKRHNQAVTLAGGFELVGLGEMADAVQQDQVIQF